MKNLLLATVMLVAFSSCSKTQLRRDYVCTITHTTFGRGTAKTDTMYNKTQTEIDSYCQSAYINNDSVYNQIICE